MDTLITRWKEKKNSSIRNKSMDGSAVSFSDNQKFTEEKQLNNHPLQLQQLQNSQQLSVIQQQQNSKQKNKKTQEDLSDSSTEQKQQKKKDSDKKTKTKKQQDTVSQSSKIFQNQSFQKSLSVNKLQMSSSPRVKGFQISELNAKNYNNKTYLMDEAVYKIMDCFKSNAMNESVVNNINTSTSNINGGNNISYQEKVQRVRNIIENLVQNYKKVFQSEEKENQNLNNNNSNIQQIFKQDDKLGKAEAQQKFINELQNKLFEAERQKSALKNEAQFLQNKVSILQSENEQCRISQKLLQQNSESFQIIQNVNEDFRSEIKFLKEKHEEQQRIFNQQIDEVNFIMNKLKKQITEKHEKSLSQIQKY